jgi:hypothetical protein
LPEIDVPACFLVSAKARNRGGLVVLIISYLDGIVPVLLPEAFRRTVQSATLLFGLFDGTFQLDQGIG